MRREGGGGGGINEWKWEASIAAIARSAQASGVWSVGVWCWRGRCDDDNCVENVSVIVGGVVAAWREVGMVRASGDGRESDVVRGECGGEGSIVAV